MTFIISRYAPVVEQGNQPSRQIGALPLILDSRGGFDLCLITTRGGNRWIIPKGNPIEGLAPHKVAQREALEEGGLIGDIGTNPIGSFAFNRRRDGRFQTCTIEVYPLYVERRLAVWAEARKRSVLRCKPDRAAALVSIPSFATLIEEFVATIGSRPEVRV